MQLSIAFLTVLLSISSTFSQRIPDLKDGQPVQPPQQQARMKAGRPPNNGMKDLGGGIIGQFITPRRKESGVGTTNTRAQHHEFSESYGGGQFDVTSRNWNPGPRLNRLSEYSWRGLKTEDGRLDGWDVSGFAQALPGTTDFIRLLPAESLKHGAIFTAKPFTQNTSLRKGLVKDWVIEVAFRIHGPQSLGLGTNEEGIRSVRKGGRGMAIWYTKEGSPTPPTIPSDTRLPANPAPPTALQYPTDPSDSYVSLFGGRVNFEGLGILFDTSPGIPLFHRSNRKSWRAQAINKEQNIRGAVSGVLDDGAGGGESKWFDDDKEWGLSGYKPGEEKPDTSKLEAKYLERSFGECDAAFRNSPGLVYARISHANDTIRVDMDLAPHTNLGQGSRHYDSHCLTLEGVKLPPSYHFGISALASASGEPDMVDIYAVDVFELLKNSYDEQELEAKERKDAEENAKDLEGTTGNTGDNMVHEMLVAQAAMAKALEELTAKIDGSIGTRGSSVGVLEDKLNILVESLDVDEHSDRQKKGNAMIGSRVSSSIEMIGRLTKEINEIKDTLRAMKDSYDATLRRLENKAIDTVNLLNRLQAKVDSLEKYSNRIATHAEKSFFATKQLLPLTIVGVAVVGLFAVWLSSLRKDQMMKKLV